MRQDASFLGPAIANGVADRDNLSLEDKHTHYGPRSGSGSFPAITSAGYGVMTGGVLFTIVIAGLLGSARIATGQHTLASDGRIPARILRDVVVVNILKPSPYCQPHHYKVASPNNLGISYQEALERSRAISFQGDIL